MSKLPKEIEERFDKECEHEWDDCCAHGEGQFCCLDIEHNRNKQLKSFIATILEEATKEAWIDGFMTSAEGYNGEYLGSYLTKGRTIRETVIKDIYDSEHNLIKEDEKNNL